MSKIGRKPIDIGATTVEVKGQEIHYKGKNFSGMHELPDFIIAGLDGKSLTLKMTHESRPNKKFWGLHRALLANKIYGAHTEFERQLKINGLGYKAKISGNKVNLALGFSHKIDTELPKGVSLVIDKTGQLLTFKSYDKELLGKVCDIIRSFRPPEPYKGRGIKYVDEVIRRKAGKTKAA